MVDMTDTDPTNAVTAQNATQTVSLPKFRTHLIGLFGSDDAPRALLRTGDGHVIRVGIGDAVEKGRVAAIDAARVIVARGAHSYVLRMPTARAGDVAT